MVREWYSGEKVSKEHPLVIGLHRSRRPGPGPSLACPWPVPSRQPSFPFKREQRLQRLFIPRAVVAGAAHLLPAAPRRGGGAGCGKEEAALNCGPQRDRPTDTRQACRTTRGSLRPGSSERESETPNLEKGVTWGPGAES